MLPNEIAELTLGLMEAMEGTKNFEVRTIESVKLGGHDGYRASASFTDSLGLRKRLLIHGTSMRGYVCEIEYEAAERLYYDKYLDAYRSAVSSIQDVN